MEENNKHRGGFEHSDVNVIAVGKVAVALLLVTLAAMGLLVGVFNYFKSTEGGEAKTESPRKTFPQPQLEENPIPDLAAFRAAEDETLTTYGWVDRQKGIVRIPISQAMDKVLKDGSLRARTSEPPADNVSVPTESGLGPKMLPPGGPLGLPPGGPSGDAK